MPWWTLPVVAVAAFLAGRRMPRPPERLPGDAGAADLLGGMLVGIVGRPGTSPGGGNLPGGAPGDYELAEAESGNTRNGAILSSDAF